MLRSLLILHRDAYLQLISDVRALSAPWSQNVTAAALSLVGDLQSSSTRQVITFHRVMA